MSDTALEQEMLVTLTTDIVAAHVSNNSVSVGEISALIAHVHAALSGLASPTGAPAPAQEPAVPVRSSVKSDYLVCLEDGKKLKMLKRHLMTTYQMTPADYRAKWRLPADYPMVAPNYAEQRKALAIKIGFGRKPKIMAVGQTAAKTPGKRGRKPKLVVETEPA